MAINNLHQIENESSTGLSASTGKRPRNLLASSYNQSGKRKWRDWHEREIPVNIMGENTKEGVRIAIESKELNRNLEITYPSNIWSNYRKENKVKLVDNITYIFTAHLPFLLKGNIRLDYNTGYPQTYSWANQCFMRFLPAYWFFQQGKRGTRVFPMLKTILNSRANFAETKDIPPTFPTSIDEEIIIPFTFGKDSFLTYYLAKEIGLRPTLVYYNEPTEMYSRHHKLDLIKKFEQETKEKIYFMDNPLGDLREYGEGWFGWELALTSWALLSLPYAYHHKAGYILFSNEMDTNLFSYDKDGFKVIPDYEQSAQAMEEMSLLTAALSEGEVYVTTFLQGLKDLAIISLLKNRYPQSLRYLMSCWAETEEAKDKRWCGVCTKCARLYLYLSAHGVDPIREAGFKDNLFEEEKESLYNVFGKKASGTGWDAFGLNTKEQALAFYLTYLRGNRDPLVMKFTKTPLFKEMKTNFVELVYQHYSIYPEISTPPQWKERIHRIFKNSFKEQIKEILTLFRSFEDQV